MSSVLPPRVFRLIFGLSVSKSISIYLICLRGLPPRSLRPAPAARNFDRLLMDSGHAGLENFTNNVFDPQDWRYEQVPQAESEPQQERNWTEWQKMAGIG